MGGCEYVCVWIVRVSFGCSISERWRLVLNGRWYYSSRLRSNSFLSNSEITIKWLHHFYRTPEHHWVAPSSTINVIYDFCWPLLWSQWCIVVWGIHENLRLCAVTNFGCAKSFEVKSFEITGLISADYLCSLIPFISGYCPLAYVIHDITLWSFF